MEALRYFKQAHVLRIAACEVSGRLPLMKVSDYLTWIAEVILDHVLELAWYNLVEKHGFPLREDNQPCEGNFIVLGYGKVGGIEMGYSSDLDLVFIHDAGLRHYRMRKQRVKTMSAWKHVFACLGPFDS